MAEPAPLIINSFESGLLASMPRPRPDAAFVLSYADNSLRTFQHAPGFADRTRSRRCFIVDQSQHITEDHLPIPAHGGAYFFNATFRAAWQVTDPAAVVRANLTFGEQVVSGFLEGALWPQSRRYDADDVQRAEEALRKALPTPLSIGSGLTLNGLTLRLMADQRQVDGTFAIDDEFRRQQQIQSRVNQLRGLVGNDNPYLLLQLAQHPEDTAVALQVIRQNKEHDANLQLALLDRFLTHDILTDADGDALRQMVLGGAPALSSGTAGSTHVAGSLSLGAPQPPALPPSGGGGSWGAPALGSGPSAQPVAALPPAAPPVPPGAPPVVVSSPAPPSSPPAPNGERPADRGGVKGWREFRRPR